VLVIIAYGAEDCARPEKLRCQDIRIPAVVVPFASPGYGVVHEFGKPGEVVKRIVLKAWCTRVG